MKTPEDEAFDELARKQGAWGGGFPAKRAMAADKQHWNEDEWRRNNWRCGHGWLRGEQCESCNAPQPPSEWAGIKAILDEYGLQAIDFVADFKAALAQPEQEPVLENIERYRLQMAAISTAAIGYWKEGDGIQPDYDTLTLRDVAKLYAKYDALYKAQPAQEPVAWALEWTFDGEEKGRRLYDDERHCKLDAENDGGICRPLVYGYTPPPQRTWVGLTDEQQEEMYQMTDNIADCRTCYFQGIADAEAAHNIGA